MERCTMAPDERGRTVVGDDDRVGERRTLGDRIRRFLYGNGQVARRLAAGAEEHLNGA